MDQLDPSSRDIGLARRIAIVAAEPQASDSGERHGPTQDHVRP
jgi:hypothetical protein